MGFVILQDYKSHNFYTMTKEEFELLQKRQKESGKSVKAFLAEEGIWFTRYYYWKKKYSQTKMETGLVPIEIHNDTGGHSVSLEGICGEIGGVILAFPNGLRAHFGRGSEKVLMEVFRKSLGEPCSL